MKYKIEAPNKQYDGVSCGVKFAFGVAHTESGHAAAWFQAHGYTVTEDKPEKTEAEKKAEVIARAQAKVDTLAKAVKGAKDAAAAKKITEKMAASQAELAALKTNE